MILLLREQDLKQRGINHSSNIDFKEFEALQKLYCKAIPFLVYDKNLALDNI